ncbi:hypothetical protein [Pedobacter sp. MW01-1-1]|uniref:hypothetical protein n=1 Tax=Pedobacter sp. MW01-1-1 TaxID=3383027 RepID=UPI003FEEE029
MEEGSENERKEYLVNSSPAIRFSPKKNRAARCCQVYFRASVAFGTVFSDKKPKKYLRQSTN